MRKPAQQGASLLIVLVMLTVLLLASLSVYRVTDASTRQAGGIASRAAAMQASEVGVAEAFIAVKALTDEETDVAGWYYATRRNTDQYGLPTGIDWSKAPLRQVGPYEVRYVVDRFCYGTTPVTDAGAQCFLKRLPTSGSAKAGAEALASPAVMQFRLTVSVKGPKSLQTFVQVLATGNGT